MGVYRVDPDGSIHLLISDLVRPNGIALSPDDKSLYVAEADPEFAKSATDASGPPSSGRVRILRYDLADDGTVSNRRVVIDYTGRGIGSDGIKTDRDREVWPVTALSLQGERGMADHHCPPESRCSKSPLASILGFRKMKNSQICFTHEITTTSLQRHLVSRQTYKERCDSHWTDSTFIIQ